MTRIGINQHGKILNWNINGIELIKKRVKFTFLKSFFTSTLISKRLYQFIAYTKHSIVNYRHIRPESNVDVNQKEQTKNSKYKNKINMQ